MFKRSQTVFDIFNDLAFFYLIFAEKKRVNVKQNFTMINKSLYYNNLRNKPVLFFPENR